MDYNNNFRLSDLEIYWFFLAIFNAFSLVDSFPCTLRVVQFLAKFISHRIPPSILSVNSNTLFFKNYIK